MKYTDPRITSLLALLLGAILLFIICPKLNSSELKWEKLSEQQKNTARDIYRLGKPYNLENTLVAIAWQESRLGLVPINLQDPSCGVMHINVKTYLGLHKLKDTPYNRNWYCNRLLSDLHLTISTAIEVLLWYKNYHRGNYSKMVKSYNAGFNTHLPQADKYYKEVFHNVKILQTLKSELNAENPSAN